MAQYTGSSAAILSNYDEVLKTFYLPAIQEQLNNETVLSSQIDTNEEDVSGKNATIQCHYGRTKGTGARADGGPLPTADFQKFKTCTVPMKYNYGRVTFSGPTIAATRDEKGSYARVIDTEIAGCVTDLRKEVNRQLWGCGGGVIGRNLADYTTDGQTFQKKYRGNARGPDAFGSTFGGKYVEENAGCVAVVLTGTTTITAATVDTTDMAVTAVDSTTSTDSDDVTSTDPSVTEAAGTFYVRPASLVTITSGSSAGAWRLEMMGLRGIITNTDLDEILLVNDASGGTDGLSSPNDPLQGLDVSTYAWFKALVSTHSSGRYQGQRALSLDMMQQMFDKVEIKAGKDYGPNMIMTTHAIRREYLELMQADRRNVNTMTLDGGWKALDFNGIPLMVDPDAIDGEMYFLTTKDLQIYRMSDYDWMTKDGAILSRISGYDAYEAVLFRYAEMGAKRRNSQGVICDIAYDSDR